MRAVRIAARRRWKARMCNATRAAHRGGEPVKVREDVRVRVEALVAVRVELCGIDAAEGLKKPLLRAARRQATGAKVMP